MSPQAGELDAAAVADLAERDPDAAARVLAAAARAFDPALRAAARSLAARLPLGRPRRGTPDRPGTSRVVTRREPTGSDIDLDATLAARGAEPHWRAEHLHTRGWRSTGPGDRAAGRRVGLGLRRRAGRCGADRVRAGPADATRRRTGCRRLLVEGGRPAPAVGRPAGRRRRRPVVRPARWRHDRPGAGAADGGRADRPLPGGRPPGAAAVRRDGHREPRPGQRCRRRWPASPPGCRCSRCPPKRRRWRPARHWPRPGEGGSRRCTGRVRRRTPSGSCSAEGISSSAPPRP